MFDPDITTLEEMKATLEKQLSAVRAAILALKARQFTDRDETEAPARVKTGEAGKTSFVMSSRTIPATEPDSAPMDFKPFACTMPPDMNRGGGGLRSDI